MSLITSTCNTKCLEERILILSSFAQKLQLKLKRVKFILLHSIASYDATQKMRWFLASWCRELSDGIHYEWFCSNNFQTLLYLKYAFGSLRCYLNCILTLEHPKLTPEHFYLGTFQAEPGKKFCAARSYFVPRKVPSFNPPCHALSSPCHWLCVTYLQCIM